MDEQNNLIETTETTQEKGEVQVTGESSQLTAEQKRAAIIGVTLVVLLVIAFVVFIIYLLQPSSPTDRIRDVFIIVMALQSLLIGLVLVILIVQLARLINLLQNEIGPILDSTNETVSHLRGTTVFLGENLVEPVIKLNEYLAGLTQFFGVLGLVRRSSKKKSNSGE